MKKEPFAVLAECMDSRSGRRFLPGELFDPAPTVQQATRLINAGCLAYEALAAAQQAEDDSDQAAVDGAQIQRDQLNANDGLFDLSDEQLAGIVATEQVELPDGADKVAIIAAIRAKRTAAASVPAAGTEMRTEAGERAARQADAKATGGSSAAAKPARAPKR